MTGLGANNRRKLLRTTTAGLLAVPFVVPFVFLALMALRPAEDYLADPLGWPTHLTFANIRGAWGSAHLGPALVASMISTLIGVVVVSVLSVAAAFWLFITKGRFAVVSRWLIVAGYAFPAVIWLIPLFVLLSRRGLTNNLVVLGLIYGVSNVPFGVYLLHAFFGQTLSQGVVESARLDGASVLQLFYWIAVPLAKPALATLAALVFVWSFGDLLFAVTMIQDPGKWTVTLAAATLADRDGVSASAQASGALISLLPSLAIVVVAQKALVRGFAGGGSKG